MRSALGTLGALGAGGTLRPLGTCRTLRPLGTGSPLGTCRPLRSGVVGGDPAVLCRLVGRDLTVGRGGPADDHWVRELCHVMTLLSVTKGGLCVGRLEPGLEGC